MASSIRSSDGRCYEGTKWPLRGQSLKDSLALYTSDWWWWSSLMKFSLRGSAHSTGAAMTMPTKAIIIVALIILRLAIEVKFLNRFILYQKLFWFQPHSDPQSEKPLHKNLKSYSISWVSRNQSWNPDDLRTHITPGTHSIVTLPKL